MANFMQRLVSKKKRRFQEEGFDLDMTCKFIVNPHSSSVFVVRQSRVVLVVSPLDGSNRLFDLLALPF